MSNIKLIGFVIYLQLFQGKMQHKDERIAPCPSETKAVSKWLHFLCLQFSQESLHTSRLRGTDKKAAMKKQQGLGAHRGLYPQKQNQVVNLVKFDGRKFLLFFSPPPQQDYRSPWMEAIRILSVTTAIQRCPIEISTLSLVPSLYLFCNRKA